MTEVPSWNRALTLSERDLLYPRNVVPFGFDADLARRRVRTWKEETGLLDAAQFSFRLVQQGFDTERMTYLLGSPAPPLSDMPAWQRELESAYGQEKLSPETEEMWKKAVEGQADAMFLGIVRPLLDHAWKRLQKRLDEKMLPAQSLGRFAELWATPLPRQLIWMLSRTLILELYIRRLQGDLVGTTPEERFESFLNPLCDPAGALDFLANYPVLGRNLLTRFEQWLETGVELCWHLHTDLPRLEETFGALGELVGLEPGLGDRHKKGRTVVSAEFSSGVKIVYKPRSLALDVEFQKLLAWLGEKGAEPRLRTLQVLDRGTYGWAEYIETAPCQSEDEVRRFYARQGVYLALLYVFEATDFHHENLIAVGEHPMLIDLETIFQPVLADVEEERESLNPVLTTILRSGLLPRGLDRVDLSGLGARRGQSTPMRKLTKVGTDEMGFIDLVQEHPVGDHLPSLNGKEVALHSMGDVLCESFASAYRKLLALRSEFLRPGGWLNRFAGMETRVIVRPTQVYAHLYYRSYHPDYLQDSLHRERFLDKLWLDADLLKWLPKAIPAERRDLSCGDIPRFNTYTDSRDLFSENFLLSDVLPQSGLDLSHQRLVSLGEEDLQRQVALLRLSVESTRQAEEPFEDDARTQRVLPAVRAERGGDEFIAAARRVGERLETLSFGATNWISWFHLSPNADGSQSLLPVSFDLYSGLGGIALFYAHLARRTGESRWKEIAQRALATGKQRFDQQPEEQRSRLGGYSGLGGWIYTLTHLSLTWDEPHLLDAAESASALVLPAVEHDESLDIIAGSAGCIAGLLALYHHRPSAVILEAAIRCGDHLLARAEEQENGKAWRLPVADLPLTGFSHGAAGIAWALARLASQTGDGRFEDAARAALTYERGLFSPEHSNWPDLRKDRLQDGGWAYFHAWCHGAPGIGLSRLSLLDFLQDDKLESEIRAALRSTEMHGFGGSQCLCHGDLGNLELLLRAGKRLDDRHMRHRAHELAGWILAGLDRDGARCGLSSPVELPGLMTGLAGIGYGLLQIATPEEVPSVLLLETGP